VSECGFAETRRAVEEHMIERFPSPPCGFDKNFDLFLDLNLSQIILKTIGPQVNIEERIDFPVFGTQQPLSHDPFPAMCGFLIINEELELRNPGAGTGLIPSS
jgi:hypothetical protein